MFSLFFSGGPMMFIQLLLVIVILVLTTKKALELRKHIENRQVKLESGINAIIFWGAISLVLGFFAHFLGMYHALQAISKANDISPSIVAAGYSVSLITIIFGLLIFLLSAVSWFTLRWQFKKTIAI